MRQSEIVEDCAYLREDAANIAIAGRIGIDQMRAANPNFDDWLTRLRCNRVS